MPAIEIIPNADAIKRIVARCIREKVPRSECETEVCGAVVRQHRKLAVTYVHEQYAKAVLLEGLQPKPPNAVHDAAHALLRSIMQHGAPDPVRAAAVTLFEALNLEDETRRKEKTNG